MNSYDKGDRVRVTFYFWDVEAAAYVDPTAVFFSWKIGKNGTVTTYTYGVGSDIVQSATGRYYVDIPASAVGIYYTRSYSTGVGMSAEERQFEVKSEF